MDDRRTGCPAGCLRRKQDEGGILFAGTDESARRRAGGGDLHPAGRCGDVGREQCPRCGGPEWKDAVRQGGQHGLLGTVRAERADRVDGVSVRRQPP